MSCCCRRAAPPEACPTHVELLLLLLLLAAASHLAGLALLRNVGEVVAEAAEQPPVALVAQVVEADAC